MKGAFVLNKAVLVEELGNAGIIMTSFEFCASGYILDLKLNPDRATGWEALEHLPIVGLELAKTRFTGEYTRKVLFVPSNNKEFKDYVNKHINYFGLGKHKALSDLQEAIDYYGTKHTKIELAGYIKRIGKQ